MKLTVFWLKFHWILLRWIFLQFTVSHPALVYNGLVLKRWQSITRTNDAWTRFMKSYDMHYSGHRLNRSLYAEKKSIRNFELNVQIFFEEYALENVICKLSTILQRAQSICNDLWWHPNVWYIKNNAWVTVNNDFWVTSEAICQWFSWVTKSRVKIIGKIASRVTQNRYSR